ncbi:MAG: hypothetical protein WDO70_06775 [Alphaproteobacteria bacterium]
MNKTYDPATLSLRQDIALSSQFRAYAMLTDARKTNEYTELSAEKLMAIPVNDRDIVWLAHCIEKSPGYALDTDVFNVINDSVNKRNSSAKQIQQSISHLEKSPQLYSPPYPLMWLEWDIKHGGNAYKQGVFIEDIGRQSKKSGIRVTLIQGNEGHLYPSLNSPISMTFGTPGHMQAQRIYPLSLPASFQMKKFEEDMAEKLNQQSHFAYLMAIYALTTMKSRQDLTVIPPFKQEFRGKSPALLTFGNSHRVQAAIGEKSTFSDGFLGDNILELLGHARRLKEIEAPKPQIQQEALAAKSDVTSPRVDDVKIEEEKPKKEDNTPVPVALNGVVIRRIFREADKAHSSNSPERNDDIARMSWLSGQLKPFGTLAYMNAKFPPHAELASVLFGDEIMRPLEFAHVIPVNGKSKVPVVAAATRENLVQAMQKIFAVDGKKHPKLGIGDLERNNALKQHIAEFSGLVIAALGDEKSLKELRDKYTLPLHSNLSSHAESGEGKRALLVWERGEKARMLLAGIGIIVPPVDKPEMLKPVDNSPPLLPAPEKPTESVQNGAGVSTFPAAAADITAALPPVENPSLAPAKAPEAPSEKPAESVQVATDVQAKPSEAVLSPARALTEDEILERMIKRDEAFEETRTRLLADAQMYLMQAQNKELNRFECRIDLRRPDFPIQMLFSRGEDADGRKAQKANYTLEKYDQAYAERGIPLTMEDAVDLKIAVQSMIYNTEGIVPARDLTAAGDHAIDLNTSLPLPAESFDIKHRSGMHTVFFTSTNPYSKKDKLTFSIPLGLAALCDGEETEQRELDSRAGYVVDFLQRMGERRTSEGQRIHVTKRDVMESFQYWLEEQGKEWATAERFNLPGFENNTLIHVSSRGSQKITLAPVSMHLDVGGENPFWHCDLHFHVGDKDQPVMGEAVRTRSLNLHTRSQKLAVARALESLLGANSGTGQQVFEGFIPSLQRHMRSTDHEWRVKKNHAMLDEVYIGDQPLQHFLDDMARYERDIGVTLDKRETNDSAIKLTIQAIRSLTGDQRGTIKPIPELVYESEGGAARKPVTFVVPVPNDKADKIDGFLAKVHSEVRWYADEAYSSIALGDNSQESKRKKPLKYRAAQIRKGIIRAVEKTYQECFQLTLPRDWHKAPAEADFEPSRSAPVDSSSQTRLQLG